MQNASPLPIGMVLFTHRSNNVVDAAGYIGVTMSVEKQELDWCVNLFTDDECNPCELFLEQIKYWSLSALAALTFQKATWWQLTIRWVRPPKIL